MDENNIIYKVGQRIRAVRLSKNMSQADLAFSAHISLPHISDIELGKKEMSITTFSRILEVLKISADEILRLDIPKVNHMYQNEFSDLLADCTPSESEAILKIAREIKTTMHQAKKDYED